MCQAQSSVFDLRKSPLGSANMVAKKKKEKKKRKKKKNSAYYGPDYS